MEKAGSIPDTPGQVAAFLRASTSKAEGPSSRLIGWPQRFAGSEATMASGRLRRGSGDTSLQPYKTSAIRISAGTGETPARLAQRRAESSKNIFGLAS